MSTGTAARWTLYRLVDGAGVVVAFDASGQVIDGQAGFQPGDVDHAVGLADAGTDPRLETWQFLTITPEAAAYVAATFPAVCNS